MPIEGLSHLTFIVRDLELAAKFFCEGLGGQEVYDSGDRPFSLSPEKFFLVGGVWIAAMKGEPKPPTDYQHVAFRVDQKELPLFRERLTAIGVRFASERRRVEGEGESLYVFDYDGHLFELHAGTLEGRLERYR